MNLSLIVLCFAIVFAFIAALFITTVSRPPVSVHFGWLAIAFLLLTMLLGAGHLVR